MSNLTLWDIDKALDELFDALDEADTEEGQAACRQAIAEYQNREVAFIDNARGAYKHYEALAIAARQEAAEIALRARMFEQRCLRIKAMAQVVMEAHGRTKLEGRRGKFILKGNGGLQALEVTDAAQVPAECCKMVGWIREDAWLALVSSYEGLEDILEAGSDYSLERAVDNELTRKAIDREGGVPGARLAERGQHVEVR